MFFPHRELRMDLNQKTLVREEYCTAFVDCRHTNSQTSYHTVCTTDVQKKLLYNSRLSFTVCTTTLIVNITFHLCS